MSSRLKLLSLYSFLFLLMIGLGLILFKTFSVKPAGIYLQTQVSTPSCQVTKSGSKYQVTFRWNKNNSNSYVLYIFAPIGYKQAVYDPVKVAHANPVLKTVNGQAVWQVTLNKDPTWKKARIEGYTLGHRRSQINFICQPISHRPVRLPTPTSVKVTQHPLPTQVTKVGDLDGDSKAFTGSDIICLISKYLSYFGRPHRLLGQNRHIYDINNDQTFNRDDVVQAIINYLKTRTSNRIQKPLKCLGINSQLPVKPVSVVLTPEANNDIYQPSPTSVPTVRPKPAGTGLLFSSSDLTKISQNIRNDVFLTTIFNQFGRTPTSTRTFLEASFRWLITKTPANPTGIKAYLLSHSNPDVNYIKNVRLGFDYKQEQCLTLALGYDWLYPSLSATEKGALQTKMNNWLEAMVYRHKHLANNSCGLNASINFNASLYGCMSLLSLDLMNTDYSNLASQALKISKDALLNYHFDYAYNSQGDYVEGPYYQTYSAETNSLALVSLYRRGLLTKKMDSYNMTKALKYFGYARMSDGALPINGDHVSHNCQSKPCNYVGGYYLLPLIYSDDLKLKQVSRYFFEAYRKGGNRLIPIPGLYSSFDRVASLIALSQLPKPRSAKDLNLPTGLYSPGSKEKIKCNGVNYDFSKGGISILRSGWDDNQNWVVFLADRYRPQNHMGYDPNTIDISVLGKRFIAGYDDYHSKINQFNSILIDGKILPQKATVYQGSALGLIDQFTSNNELDYLRSDAKYPLADLSLFVGGSFWRATESLVKPLAKGYRYVSLFKEEKPILVVVDDVAKNDSNQHLFTAQFRSRGNFKQLNQSSKSYLIELDQPPISLFNYVISTANLHLVKSGSWLKFNSRGRALHNVYLYFANNNHLQPAIDWLVNNSNKIVLALNYNNQHYQILINFTSQPIVFDSFQTDAKISFLKYRSPTDSRLEKVIIEDGTYFNQSGQSLIRQSKPGVYSYKF